MDNRIKESISLAAGQGDDRLNQLVEWYAEQPHHEDPAALSETEIIEAIAAFALAYSHEVVLSDLTSIEWCSHEHCQETP